MNLPIIELFTSIQGEGVWAGCPSLFIRLSGCNLRCVFKNSICDTAYASFSPEKSHYTMKDVEEITDLDKVEHIVVTGGEPLLYQDSVVEMLGILKARGNYKITVETNGTIVPCKELLRVVDLWSVSPKMSNSVMTSEYKDYKKETAENHDKLRINLSALRTIVLSPDRVGRVQFKFVYSCNSTDDEIKELLEKVNSTPEALSYYKPMVYLMPEGMTSKELSLSRKRSVEACIKNNWTYTDRLHIIIWGNKRGV